MATVMGTNNAMIHHRWDCDEDHFCYFKYLALCFLLPASKIRISSHGTNKKLHKFCVTIHVCLFDIDLVCGVGLCVNSIICHGYVWSVLCTCR